MRLQAPCVYLKLLDKPLDYMKPNCPQEWALCTPLFMVPFLKGPLIMPQESEGVRPSFLERFFAKYDAGRATEGIPASESLVCLEGGYRLIDS